MKNKKTNRRALIFCAGPGVRWTGHTRKQLVEVDGERLLDRMVRQCNERNVPAVVVIKPGDEELFAIKGAEQFVQPSDSEGRWCQTALWTKDLWGKNQQTIGLLGDVWYSDECFSVCCQAEGLRWVGRAGPSPVVENWPGEVWATTWHTRDAPRFEEACHASLANAEQLPPDLPSYFYASPWQPYRHAIGLPWLQCHFVLLNDPTWIEVADTTEDMDTEQKYFDYLEARAVLRERGGAEEALR
jgi:hypothetical protein